jgi:acetylornithine deacetylase/succinyl-diaminopimelate desuccinylase-like protein
MSVELLQRALANVERSTLVKRLTDLVNIPSPTGSEAEMARAYDRMLRGIGMRSVLQPVGDGRYNTVARLDGAGGSGTSVLFNGHMDTSFGGELGDRGPGFRTEATIVDDEWMYGMGTFNMKSALVAYATAIDAILKAGIRLRADVVVVGVAGEIEKAPTGQFEGPLYQGYGVGTKFAISHGAVANVCILGEPTDFNLVLEHAGSAWFKITVPGVLAHTAWSDHNRNAISRASLVVDALNKWMPDYKKRKALEGFEPRVNIAAIDGGWAWRGARSPDSCSVYVDVRMPPKMLPTEALAEIRGVVSGVRAAHAGFEATVDIYCSNPGTSTPDGTAFIREIDTAHLEELGKPCVRTIENWYSDAAHMNRYGIATVNYGSAGRIRSGGAGWSASQGEHIHIGDLEAMTRIYTRLLFRLCGVAQ